MMGRAYNYIVNICFGALAIFFLFGLFLVAGCGGGDTNSAGCTSTSTTDANGNPINTVSCGGD